MRDQCDSRRPRRRIEASAKERFLVGLRAGAHREDAAAAAGFSLMGFYNARHRDAAFAAAWVEALATSAAAERRALAYAGRSRGEIRIAAANRRFYQRRRRRNVRFDADAQAVFLAHFTATCDTRAAAAAAGIHESTVHLRRRTDRAFAEAYAAALAEGYVVLEAEAVRLRLAAQAKLRAVVEHGAENPPRDGEGDRPAAPGGGGGSAKCTTCPHCGADLAAAAADAAADAEFDRVMKLLARWDRKPRGPDSRFTPGGRRQQWTFDMAIALLDKKLRAMGARTLEPPPEEGEEAD